MPRHVISQLAHVELLTPQLDESVRFFEDVIGLEASARDGASVYLRAWGETFHHSLKLTTADTAGLGHVGWRAESEEALQAVARDLEAAGLGRGWTSGDLGHGRAYRFNTPGGHVAEVFWDVERYAAPPQLRSRFPNRTQKPQAKGAGVRFLHHANLASRDVARDRAFFADLLGFAYHEGVYVPGREMEVLAFLACTNLDHDLGLTIDAQGGQGRLHHVAYALDSREAVLLAADTAVEAGLTIELGPTKHGVGESFFFYVHEPAGHRIEIYGGGYLTFEPDRPTVKWYVTQTPHPMLAWGGTLPETLGGGRNLAERMASLRTVDRQS